MDKILTIIIPTYNMEGYLCQCLDSLIILDRNQKYLEVLIVNDGSKDASSLIGHEYELKYPQTFRVIDKENGNYGSCINRGLKEATGKYIKVLDADDSFYKDSIDEFITYLASVNDDMVITDYDLVNSYNKVLRHVEYNLPSETSFSVDKIEFNNWFRMHAITYKTCVLKESGYKQTEGISYTDIEWSTIPLRLISTVRYCPITLYRYLVGREGQTVDPKVKQKSLWMTIKVFDKVMGAYKVNYNDLGNAKEITYKKLYQVACSIYKTALNSQDKDLLEMITAFDRKLKETSIPLYEDLSNAVFSRFFRFRYIYDWREKPHKKYYYWGIYSFMRKLNNKFHLNG